jgi:hypothetical protein
LSIGSAPIEEMVMSRKGWFASLAGMAIAVSSVTAADAQTRKRGGQDDGYVKTCSIYGNGCTSAPIRRGSAGYEFRMPGGSWVSCRLDCKTALREETVDFWETQRERAGDSLQ